MDQNLLKEPGYKAWTSSIHDMYQLSAWSQDLHRHLFDLPKAILYRWTVVVLMGLCGQMHQNIGIKSVILKICDKAIAIDARLETVATDHVYYWAPKSCRKFWNITTSLFC